MALEKYGRTTIRDICFDTDNSGGTFVRSGSDMMAQSFSDSEQGVIALRVGDLYGEFEAS